MSGLPRRRRDRPTTGAIVKRVLRFDTWLDPVFDATCSARPDVRVIRRRFADPREESLRALAEAHVLHLSPAKDEVPRDWFVTAALLSHCPSLLIVSSAGAGYDTIEVDACTRAGVAVVNQAGGNAVSVAEHTLGLILAVAHRIAESDRALRTRRGFTREDLMGHEISGRVLGLVGIGHTGTRVAALGAAFGMRVLAVDPLLAADEIARRGATPVGLDDLLEQADVVSLHCPRDASTLNMISTREFARMKHGAIFVSTARGGIHDEVALHAALERGHLGGAGLDVWVAEPPPLDAALLRHESVVATFHTAGVTHEARRNVARLAAEQIVDALDGRRPPRLINPEVRDSWKPRFERLLGRMPAPWNAD